MGKGNRPWVLSVRVFPAGILGWGKRTLINYLRASVFSLILVEFTYSHSAQADILAWEVPFLWEWLNVAVWKGTGKTKAALPNLLHAGQTDQYSKGLLHRGRAAPLLKPAFKLMVEQWVPAHTACRALPSLKLHCLSACEAGTPEVRLHGWTWDRARWLHAKAGVAVLLLVLVSSCRSGSWLQ